MYKNMSQKSEYIIFLYKKLFHPRQNGGETASNNLLLINFFFKCNATYVLSSLIFFFFNQMVSDLSNQRKNYLQKNKSLFLF